MGEAWNGRFPDKPSSPPGQGGGGSTRKVWRVDLARLLFRPLGSPFRLLDRWDERQAKGLRAELGERKCLVSWHRQPDGRWLARLSGPGLVVTIERTARRRRRAIVRSTHAMDRILAHHAERLSKPRAKKPRGLG